MPLKILLIDDSRLARAVARHLIESIQADCEVFESSDGASAIAFLDHQTVDIAIVDVNMPGLSGLDLIEVLREKKPDLKLGILTANIQQGVQKKASDLKVHFFSKPITEDSVRQILKTFSA